MTLDHPRFLRDRFTLLAYAMLGYFAYLQAAPGVAMPLLREDLDLSYTVGGLHVSALATGMVIASLYNDRVVARLGRPVVFWIGGGGMALGALLLAAGRHPAITIGSMAIMGLFGTALLSAIQSGLADRHGNQRAIALTEANVVSSASTILPPLLIGGFEQIKIGWQWAFVVPALAWTFMYVRERSLTIPRVPHNNPAADGDSSAKPVHSPLPRIFWVYWVAMIFAVSVEWSLVAWGADFMVKASDLSNANASLLMSMYFGAMLTGRITGSRLAHYANLPKLLLTAIGVGVGGFMLLWLAPFTALRIVGLFIAGLGVANMFPFLLAVGLSTAPEQSDAASSRLTLGIGLAILLAPQILGTTADQTGIRSAFGLVFVMLALTLMVVISARRMEANPR